MIKTPIRPEYKTLSKGANLSESYTPNGYGGVELASTSENVKKTRQIRILTSDEVRQTVHNKTGIKTERVVKKDYDNFSIVFPASHTFDKLIDFHQKTDPLKSARLRGQKIKKQLLYKDDHPFSREQVGELLKITCQAVDERRSQGKLLGLSLEKKGYLYPSWQFKDGELLTGLDRVLSTLKEYDEWTKLMFLRTGDIRLEGKTPLECLQTGEIESVIRAAECYGKHIAA